MSRNTELDEKIPCQVLVFSSTIYQRRGRGNQHSRNIASLFTTLFFVTMTSNFDLFILRHGVDETWKIIQFVKLWDYGLKIIRCRTFGMIFFFHPLFEKVWDNMYGHREKEWSPKEFGKLIVKKYVSDGISSVLLSFIFFIVTCCRMHCFFAFVTLTPICMRIFRQKLCSGHRLLFSKVDEGRYKWRVCRGTVVICRRAKHRLVSSIKTKISRDSVSREAQTTKIPTREISFWIFHLFVRQTEDGKKTRQVLEQGGQREEKSYENLCSEFTKKIHMCCRKHSRVSKSLPSALFFESSRGWNCNALTFLVLPI